MNENEKMFKAYLRSLIRQLKSLKKALDSNDIDEAKKITNEIIEDTQNNIED